MQLRSLRGAGALVPLALFCLLSPKPAVAQDCEHSAERNATGSLSGVDRIHVIAGSGELTITGRSGVTAMTARGRACASDADDLDDLRLEVRRSGSTLVLEAMYPDDDIHFGRYYARIDLEVDVPAGASVVIEDGSGSLSVTGTGETRISDGSGEIAGRDIRGALVVRDGSGDIDLRDIGGEIDIEDGSGEIEVERASGAVAIEDGSGDLRVHGAGSVRVRDGSGDLSIRDIRGDVTVAEDGSGSIRVERVGGNFTVEDDGSGSVRYTDVAGRVHLPDDD